MRSAIFIACSVLFGALPTFAVADEQLTPLAVSGDWAAFEHRESMEDPPDFCLAAEPEQHFYLRADNDDIEIRYSDDSWSLPANVTGTLDLKINGDDYPLSISDNTNNMVIATVTQDQIEKIVFDMNKVATLKVTAGSAPSADISLAGSNQAITAFLTCANINQPGNTGGANPFSTPTQ